MRGRCRGGNVAGMTHEDRLQAANMTDDELARWVADSRKGQGLPPTVADGAALDRMARTVTPPPVESDARPARGRG